MIRILMGSESDREVMEKGLKYLEHFGVEYEIMVISAHRDHEKLKEYVSDCEKNTEVFIAGAGLAAHLPGVLASITAVPVIGVPIYSKYTGGLDALYSIVQMPKGVPVMTVGINNSINACLSAIRIIALSDRKVADKYREFMNNSCKLNSGS